MSQTVSKAVNKLGWISFFSISILGFVNFDRDVIVSLALLALSIIVMSLSAHFIGKPLRAEFETGRVSTEEVKKQLLKHPGLWLCLLFCFIVTFTFRG
jgi:uncharacterized membrane protein